MANIWVILEGPELRLATLHYFSSQEIADSYAVSRNWKVLPLDAEWVSGGVYIVSLLEHGITSVQG